MYNESSLREYTNFIGLCQKGSLCKYKHHEDHIRICKLYLKSGCTNRNCLFNHEGNEFNLPLCRFYLENKCSNSQCHFLHHKPPNYDDLTFEIWVCRPFAIRGWCSRGKQCMFLHVLNCPDFEEDGVCPKGNSCTLAHPITKRTQQLMITPATKYVRPDEDEVDVGSDTEKKVEKTVVSSYTVEPSLLFIAPILNGKYDIYIDQEDTNTFKENSEFLIEDSSESDDDLERNTDFIGIEN